MLIQKPNLPIQVKMVPCDKRPSSGTKSWKLFVGCFMIGKWREWSRCMEFFIAQKLSSTWEQGSEISLRTLKSIIYEGGGRDIPRQ